MMEPEDDEAAAVVRPFRLPRLRRRVKSHRQTPTTSQVTAQLPMMMEVRTRACAWLSPVRVGERLRANTMAKEHEGSRPTAKRRGSPAYLRNVTTPYNDSGELMNGTIKDPDSPGEHISNERVLLHGAGRPYHSLGALGENLSDSSVTPNYALFGLGSPTVSSPTPVVLSASPERGSSHSARLEVFAMIQIRIRATLKLQRLADIFWFGAAIALALHH